MIKGYLTGKFTKAGRGKDLLYCAKFYCPKYKENICAYGLNLKETIEALEMSIDYHISEKEGRDVILEIKYPRVWIYDENIRVDYKEMQKMKRIKNIVTGILVATMLTLSSVSINALDRGYNQNDITMPSGLSVEQIRSALPYNLKPLANKICSIDRSDTPINALFLASIVRLETGNGTSYSYKYRNNVGGVMGRRGLRTFRSKEECLDYMHHFLSNKYVARGLRTP